MEQRVSLITIGVADLEAAAAFYEALGWQRVETPEGIVVFDLIGQALGLYPLAALAADIGVPQERLGHGAVTLSHNLSSPEAVDALLERAGSAGADILRSGHEVFWGGYIGYFRAPDGSIWEIAHNPFSALGPNGEFRWNGYG
ncbi:VOC family protein [Ruegeria marina]|nr:VOC family protein [Ruegeria marina]